MKKNVFEERRPDILEKHPFRSKIFDLPGGINCFQPHWHDTLEILYVIKGELHGKCNGVKYIVEGGQTVIFPPYSMHMGNTGKDDTFYYLFQINVPFLENSILDFKKYIRVLMSDNENLSAIIINRGETDIFDRLVSEHENENKDFLRITPLLYEVIYLLTKYIPFDDKNLTAVSPFKKAYDEIVAKHGLGITTSTLSEQYGYTNEHFCRSFKKENGETPYSVILNERMKYAKRQIENGAEVSKVADLCGYGEKAYFMRAYRKFLKSQM